MNRNPGSRSAFGQRAALAAISFVTGLGCTSERREPAPGKPPSTAAEFCATPDPAPAVLHTIQRAVALEEEAANRGQLPAGTLALQLPTTIQVRFHVLDKADASGNIIDGNVTDAKIAAQIQALNDAFSGVRGGVDTQFRFALAGVTRDHETPTANIGWFTPRDDITLWNQIRRQRHVGTATTLNVYTDGTPSQGQTATFPWQYGTNPLYDMAVVHFSLMPGIDPNSQGMTLVHEVGHWLGLAHTFQGGCGTTGDFVSDTPAHTATQNCGTPQPDSCPMEPGTDPVNNYMNYQSDSCYTQFTERQASRMRALWQYSRLNPPTVSVALVGGSGWTSVPLAAVSVATGTVFRFNNAGVGSSFGSFAATAGVVPLVGDFNGDFFSDIALTGGAGWLSIPVATSDPTIAGFLPPTNNFVQGPAGGSWGSFAATANVKKIVGDFNRDGKSDIALLGGSGWNSIPVATSLGSGNFSATNVAVAGFEVQGNAGIRSEVGDFNGDGRSDLVLFGDPQWTQLRMALASSTTGSFTSASWSAGSFSEWSSQPGVRSLAADFDGDGRTDLAVIGGPNWLTQPVAFARSNGSFEVTNFFVNSQFATLARYATKIVARDFDLDGRADIALVGQMPTPPGLTSSCGSNWDKTAVAISNGDGTFGVVQDPIGCTWAGWAASTPHAIVGDFDHDGLPDQLLIGGAWPNFKLAKIDENDIIHGSYEPPIETNASTGDPNLTEFNGWAVTANVTVLQGEFWHPVPHADER